MRPPARLFLVVLSGRVPVVPDILATTREQ